MKFFRKIKNLYHKLIHSHASTEEVAQGFALGVFISVTPTLGLHTILAIGLAALLKKNEIATILGAWVVNPLTLVPVYYFIYRLGYLLMGEVSPRPFQPENIRDFFKMGGEILLPLWLGGLVVGIVGAVLSYYLMKWIYPYLKKKKEQIQQKIGRGRGV